ncbi:DUF2182 domain-containing protein [Yoonia sp.]|uniref:DUF2182 domain-containing protein n=1 Tax=Yoonia sp. TaxID=2212373 RepID=UPI0023B53A56
MPHVIRSTLWVLFFGTILFAWWTLYSRAVNMDLDLLGRPGAMGQAMADMDPRMFADVPMARFWSLFGMWAVMMAAMMLPTMVPTLTTYEHLMESADGTRAGWMGVLLGYFIVWVAFAGLIAGVQVSLLFGGVINMLGVAPLWFSAVLLIVVGVYQFSHAKEVCHGVCHAPMTYFLGHWRTGFGGGLHMGLRLGAYCVGCCWGYMALGFVGGVMSLAWMGLATLLMIFEKLPDIGHHVIKPTGVVLIAAGFGLFFI